MTTIREFIYEISPPWMRDEVAATINRAFGTVLDALGERVEQGVRLRFPGMGSPTALAYIGNDRDMERGPTQTDAGYAVQLQQAFDTWQNAGGARTILSQLHAYFAPNQGPPLRLVAQHPSGAALKKAIWHQINTVTGVVTKSYRDNWLWDNTTKWHRGWVIIDGTGRWKADYWDQVGTWGDGGVWGSDMTYDETRFLVSIVRKWKPANVLAQIILTFDPSLFEESDARPPNPNGNAFDDEWRAAQPAAFLEPTTT